MNLECKLPNVSSVSVAGLSIKENLLIIGDSLKAYSLSGSGEPVWSHVDGTIDHLCVSRDERSLAASSSNIIKLHDISRGRETRRLVDHSSAVTCISSFSRSPYQWITGDEEGVCRVSDARRHPSTLISLRQSRPVRCAQASPDDSLIVIGDDSCLQLYDMRQRKLLSRFIYSSYNICFHPGERLMASFGEEGIIRFWDLDSLECVSQSEPFNDRILNAHFSYQGDSLIACSSDQIRCLSWEPCTLEWSHSLQLSPTLLSSHLDKNDKLHLIVSDQYSIKVFASPLSTIEAITRDEDRIEVKEGTEVIEPHLSHPSFPPDNEVIYLNPRKDDERSLRVLSLRAHSPTFQFTPASTKSSASNTNRLSKATSKITVEGDKKKKMEERKGSLKRREGKSSIDILSIIDMDHSFVLDHLNGASTSLRGIKEAFRKGLIPQVIEACIRDTNMAVLCSLCRQCSYQNRWNLSLSQCVLPHLTLLLCSIHRELRACGISALSSILNAVGSLVNTMTRNGVPNEIGVDIAAEDRMKMCNSIQKELVLIQLRENDMMKVMSDDERSQLSAILAIFPG